MPKPLSAEEHDAVVKLLMQCDEPETADRLTDWERNFVQSVTEQFANTNWLSPDKQIPKLKQIVEGESGSSGKDHRRFSRPSKLSYGSSEAAGPPSGGFSGFTRPRSEDQSGGDD